MVLLNSVRMITLQFSFSNAGIVPASIKRLGRETQEEYLQRKNRSSGTMIIEPTENSSLAEFLKELESVDYELVDAFVQVRTDSRDWHRKYHIVRFLFAPEKSIELSGEFKEARDTIRAELQSICESALWRVRAFSNPFYKNGQEIPGQRAISINLEVRQPLYYPSGQPRTIWQRDKKGKKIGEGPIPIRPQSYLRILREDAVGIVRA